MKSHIILLSFIILSSSLFAGGPLSTYMGRAVIWNKNTISYHLDCGPLGVFDSVSARNIAKQSFQVWQDVPTATIAFSENTLSVNVDQSNYSTYLDNYSDGINPIIFDSDGSIIQDLFGTKFGILGFAVVVDYDGDGYYDEGESVINGYVSSSFTKTEWVATFVHEYGHFIGLDHTQINGHYDADPSKTIYIPTMYPSATANDEPLASLNPDDVAAVSALYPTAGYSTTVGSINGSIVYADGSPARGVNVIAIKTSDTMMYKISTVSDYFWHNTGLFTILGLEPGTYYVRIEPINKEFIGGSSVGPFASDTDDISFQNPVAPEYYNGANESHNSFTDIPEDRIDVIVSANSTTSNINLKTNGNQFTSILQYNTNLFYVFDLPSEYGDTRYAVRFTPTISAKIKAIGFYIYEKPATNLTKDTLIISMHENVLGSLGGVPSNIALATKKTTYETLKINQYNNVDFSNLNISVTKNLDFHIVFSTKAKSGNTLSFVTDDGSTAPTNRSSSFFNNTWLNFVDANNYKVGYNLAVRVYLDTAGVIINEVETYPDLPISFALYQNYPNPFNPATTITYEIPINRYISLKIFDVLGREIKVLKDGVENAGRHKILFDGSNLTSGVYFCILNTGDIRITKRMLLLK